MKTLSQILIGTNILCIIFLLMVFITMNTHKATISTIEIENTELRNTYIEYTKTCEQSKIDYQSLLLTVKQTADDDCQKLLDKQDDDYKWSVDNLDENYKWSMEDLDKDYENSIKKLEKEYEEKEEEYEETIDYWRDWYYWCFEYC